MKASITPGSVDVTSVSAAMYSGIALIVVNTVIKRPECCLGSSIGPDDASGLLIMIGDGSDNPDTIVNIDAETDEEKALFRTGFDCLFCNRYGPTVVIAPRPGGNVELRELYTKEPAAVAE